MLQSAPLNSSNNTGLVPRRACSSRRRGSTVRHRASYASANIVFQWGPSLAGLKRVIEIARRAFGVAQPICSLRLVGRWQVAWQPSDAWIVPRGAVEARRRYDVNLRWPTPLHVRGTPLLSERFAAGGPWQPLAPFGAMSGVGPPVDEIASALAVADQDGTRIDAAPALPCHLPTWTGCASLAVGLLAGQRLG